MEVRYIGKAVDPWARLTRHLNLREYQTPVKKSWIKLLRRKKKKPILEILEECESSNATRRENYYIRKFKKNGKLLNQKLKIQKRVPEYLEAIDKSQYFNWKGKILLKFNSSYKIVYGKKESYCYVFFGSLKYLIPKRNILYKIDKRSLEKIVPKFRKFGEVFLRNFKATRKIKE